MTPTGGENSGGSLREVLRLQWTTEDEAHALRPRLGEQQLHYRMPLQVCNLTTGYLQALLGSGLTEVVTGGMSRLLTNTMLNCLLGCYCR